ncbi:hypothetical protein RQP46_004108 [Phenoliferia psychrophenolica]
MGNAESMPAVTQLHGYIDRKGGCEMMMNVSAAECDWAHRWFTNWNTADLAYGQPVVILCCAVVALFTAANAIHLMRQTRTGTILLLNLPAYKFLAGFFRGVGGRQARIVNSWSLPSGTTLLITGLVVFCAGLCLGPQKFGSSPPIATRAGWMSIALLPFQVILASKWNLITVCTGISHEKLQPLHRWTAWTMYVLALIHTFPFIVVSIKTGVMEANWRTFTYWSGVAALIPNTFLVTMSIAAIRNRYYETFKGLHFIVAAFFIVMLFLHCGFTQTSADYFIGFATVYLFSLLVRWGKSLKHGFGHRASFELLPDQMLRITIPSQLEYAPGQHFIFRFLGTGPHSWTSHPFTTASISSSGELEVFARVGRGITARLASMAADKKSLDWFKSAFEATIAGAAPHIDINIHITSPSAPPVASRPAPTPRRSSSSIISEDKEGVANNGNMTISNGRPDLSAVVAEQMGNAGTLGVAVCGPSGLTSEVRNAVARGQLRIATGSTRLQECFLHTEAYGCLLITPTTYLTPSLSSLRALLQATSSSLSSSTTDAELKRYLKEVVQDRKLVEDGVRREIKRFRLGAGAGRGNKGEVDAAPEDEDEDGVEVEELSLKEALERLTEEESRLETELEELESAVVGSKGELDASVEELATIPRLPVAPSVKRTLEESLSTMERDVKRFRGKVEEIGKRAAEET